MRTYNFENEEKLRSWARQNYKPGDPVSVTWHPVVRSECLKINAEHRDKNANARHEHRLGVKRGD